MKKQILKNNEAIEALLEGINEVVDVVKLTAGPKGRNVAIEREYAAALITNDGKTISDEIELSDKYKNVGASIVKDAAKRTNDEVGDGTTTTQIFTQAFANAGYKYVSREGVDVNDMREGMKHAAQDLINSLDVKKDVDPYQVAYISSESHEIAKIVSEVIKEVGPDGVVNVQESNQFGITYELSKGLELSNGFASKYMATNLEKMVCELDNVNILVTDNKIESTKDVNQVGELIIKMIEIGHKSIVIIANDFSPAAIRTLDINSMNTGFKVLAVRAPGFAEGRTEWLEDIASVVGANVVSFKAGNSYDLNNLGATEKIISNKDKTTIIGGKGNSLLRISQINTQIQESKTEYEKKKLKERLGRLVGAVAIIRVGADSESEIHYLKLKVDDTVAATKAALEEGIVCGGGIALIHASTKIDCIGGSESFRIGYNIVKDNIKSHFAQILINGSYEPAGIIEKVKEGKGFNAKTGELVKDMIKTGIIDPVKVTRTALKNAVSAASIVLTTNAIITNEQISNSQREN